MYPATPFIPAADELAVSATAGQFATLKMLPGVYYLYTANTNAWLMQGITDIVYTANATTDVCTTATAHGLKTGNPVQTTNSGGGLPTGLSAATVYWAIVVDALNFQLATTRANALAGTQINITDAGTGTQTATTIATLAAGSMYVPLGTQTLLNGNDGTTLSVVRDTADGKASLAPVRL
jgi:hypothetical protein